MIEFTDIATRKIHLATAAAFAAAGILIGIAFLIPGVRLVAIELLDLPRPADHAALGMFPLLLAFLSVVFLCASIKVRRRVADDESAQ